MLIFYTVSPGCLGETRFRSLRCRRYGASPAEIWRLLPNCLCCNDRTTLLRFSPDIGSLWNAMLLYGLTPTRPGYRRYCLGGRIESSIRSLPIQDRGKLSPHSCLANGNHYRPFYHQGPGCQAALTAAVTTTPFVHRIGYHPATCCAARDFERSPCARIWTDANSPAATGHTSLL